MLTKLRKNNLNIKIGQVFMQEMFSFLTINPLKSRKQLLSIISFTIHYQVQILGLDQNRPKGSKLSTVDLYTRLELHHFFVKHNDLNDEQIKAMKIFLRYFESRSTTLIQELKFRLERAMDQENKNFIKYDFKTNKYAKFTLFSIAETETEYSSPESSPSDKQDDCTMEGFSLYRRAKL